MGLQALFINNCVDLKVKVSKGSYVYIYLKILHVHVCNVINSLINLESLSK